MVRRLLVLLLLRNLKFFIEVDGALVRVDPDAIHDATCEHGCTLMF